MGIGTLLLNPLWAQYSPPFPMPRVLPPITAPVDGVFYLWNTEYGYRWSTRDPLSLWFHPLLSILLRLLPSGVPLQFWFWLVSLAFAAGALFLTYHMSSVLSKGSVISARMLPLCLLVPGGLGIATGNAEIPTLFFTLALILSIIGGQQLWLTIAYGAAAILVKPNALYMVPVLCVYMVAGWLEGNTRLWRQALVGICAILGTWVAWSSYVDLQTDQMGAYWAARLTARTYVAGDAPGFFNALAQAFLYKNDIRDQIRYSTALIIPVVNLWIIGFLPLTRERDRYAMAVGNIVMLAITLLLGNPNKIIVYTTTLPGYFPSHLLLIRHLSIGTSSVPWPIRLGGIIIYTCYCVGMLLLYVLGTPLGWYY